MKIKPILLATSVLTLAPSAAWAQAQDQSTTQPSTVQEAPSSDETNTVTVTARKRAESVLTVPVSITAYTGNDLETRGVQTTSDLAAFTPGLTAQVASSGGSRADRSTQLFYLRGITPSSTNFPTVSVFINGAPVGTASLLQNLDDLDHVEVLKGPQSAYFGRQVFAGAINVVTKPAGDTLSGDFSGEAATRDSYRASGGITVPVMQGLSFRIGGLYDKHDGSYANANNPSQTLGDQKTYGGHVAVTIKPDDNLTIKAFGTYFEDHDGPPATGIFLFNGPAAFNQSNCKINNVAFYCGTLPGLITSVSPSQIANLTPAQVAFFNNPGGLISTGDIVRGYGLARKSNHVDVSIDWKVPQTGLTLSYLAGFNRDNVSEVSDLSNLDAAANGQYPGYAGFPFLVETREHDYSHELRLASDPLRRFRFLVGGSYLNVYRESINYGGFVLAPQGTPTISLTRGAFFSVSFDALSNLTLTAEGRYQWDTQEGLSLTHALVLRGTSRSFLPRVTVQYKPIPGAMVYATYSEGVNPGVYNAQYSTFPAISQAKLNAVGATSAPPGTPEKLYNYEVGVKGRFFDGRVTLQLAAYYDKWRNQLLANTYIFQPNDPANPYNVPGYSQYNPNNVSTLQFQYTSSDASSNAKGIEGESTIVPIKNVTLNFVGAINNTKYNNFLCTGGTLCPTYPYTSGSATATGFQAAGKRLPYAPEYSTAVGAQYGHSTSLFGATDFFARVDYLYHSGIFIDTSNLAKTPHSNTVNLRAGINFTHFEVEGFVNNVTNERSYTTGFENVNFAGGFVPTIMVGLPTLITAGGRVRMRF